MKYAALYQEWLEGKIAEGGSVEFIESCINQYNAIPRPDFQPGPIFAQWREATPFSCVECGAMFHAAEDLQLDKEPTCEKHTTVPG